MCQLCLEHFFSKCTISSQVSTMDGKTYHDTADIPSNQFLSKCKDDF